MSKTLIKMLVKLSTYLNRYKYLNDKRLSEYNKLAIDLEKLGKEEDKSWLEDFNSVSKTLVQVDKGHYCRPDEIEQAKIQIYLKVPSGFTPSKKLDKSLSQSAEDLRTALQGVPEDTSHSELTPTKNRTPLSKFKSPLAKPFTRRTKPEGDSDEDEISLQEFDTPGTEA